jgi:hypothetical protein
MRKPNLELTEEGEVEDMRDSGRRLRVRRGRLTMATRAIQWKGAGVASGGYLVESKRLGIAGIGTLIPP